MKRKYAVALAASLLLAPAPVFAQSGGSNEGFVTVQPGDQWLASLLIGQAVTNDAGETIGDINDLLVDKSGKVVNVVIGVGGFLGIGEKDVAIPYSALDITAAADGKRVIKVGLSRERLHTAPDFKATEKTVFMRAREQANDMGQKAIDKASELRDKATRKIDEMRRDGAK